MNILLVLGVTVLVLSCQTRNTPPSQHTLQGLFAATASNYQQLSVFMYRFSVGISSLQHTLHVSGVTYCNKPQQTCRISFVDSLLDQPLVDCWVFKNALQMYVYPTKTFLKTSLSSSAVHRDLLGFALNVRELVSVLVLDNPLCPHDKALVKTYSPVRFFIHAAECRQIVEFYEAQYPRVIMFFSEERKTLEILYKKYQQAEPGFYPKRVDLYEYSSQTKVLLSITEFRHMKSIPENVFKVPEYHK